MKDLLRKLNNRLLLPLHSLTTKWFPSAEERQIRQQQRLDFKQKQTFYSSFIQAGDLCFDVGANMGNRIDPLLAIGARVLAVEPQEACYTHLRKKYGHRIQLVTKGLGETPGTQDFHLSNASTISSFSKEWIDAVKEDRFKEYQWNEVVKVEMTTLDELIRQYGLPAFIKIDVEGYELQVLKGLHHPIPMISFEYTVPEQLTAVIECLNRIEENGASIECNYSIGESMHFALGEWMSVPQLKTHCMSEAFKETLFGDIYVRHNA